MTVTIKDVAKRAGVSPSTVSRVISNHPRISEETSLRVRKVMDEIGYHPNMMAKSLVSRTTSTIAVILPRPADELFQNLFFSEVIRGIVTQSTRSGYDLLMATGTTEREELETVTRLVRGRRVDGILLLYSRANDPVIAMLKEADFPFAIIGRNEDYPDILTIDNDNVQASYDATRHLISQGHERIGFVSGPPNLIVSRDRLAGYTKAVREARLPVRSDWIVEGEFLQESGYRAMSLLMGLPERPTALVVVDDVVTFGILCGLVELGYSVPKDIALVSFNNIVFSELATPPISSIDIGIYQLGYTASQELIRFIQHEHPSHALRHIIPHRLVVRESSLRRS
ncbi:LacI family transcriptional regulator [Paenibacillus antri]|uniref:LacI family transcriptional regulator n=1 Tax=Paenibacillus antri TaxID=2582848 RepID=A0A5R9G302_9BACL|nr:LacI family DNA-binding transcriptional regulator [Paenibacillus antri]TLS50211.1 LacI family transcriptional regulator [Paenibacillus antri]